MMILRSSPASPFARKVRIAASLLGLADKIEVRDGRPQRPRRHDPRSRIRSARFRR